jgi:hypothetical protein
MSELLSSVSSLLLSFCQVFFPPLFVFLLNVLLLFFFFDLFFYHPLFFPFFFAFVLSLYFLVHVVSFLAYPNLFGTKRLG